jgi:hypothetical protein
LCSSKTLNFGSWKNKNKDERKEQGLASRERKEEKEKEEWLLPLPSPSRLKQAGTHAQATPVGFFSMIKPQKGLTLPSMF